ncbi:lysozyme-like [Pectinophora gossypiella]|uniref:lysozyme-like n=1 Tax=Pectinophora gossypiella TaxID=13191 RepID=UPI00214EDB83|nr:lysozyme-like [Pectinophora gossypiella]
MKFIIGITCVFLLSLSDGYKMTRCELVRKLQKYEFPEEKMRDWVCLVEKESGRRTDVVGKVNRNGSRDYGLFQINDRWWCSNTTTPGHKCNVTCSDLITDDITKAVECTRIIFRKQGFLAWHGWANHCQKDLPDISDCDAPVSVILTPENPTETTQANLR